MILITALAALSISILVRFSATLLRKALVDRLTAVNDLVYLGGTRPSGERIAGTAVIAGASIAGLLAARVCSDHFESVLVVEPENGLGVYDPAQFSGKNNPDAELTKRAHVAQYTAPHAYQVLTFLALKKLFPGFEDILLSWGGHILPADMRVHISGRSISPPPALTIFNKSMFVSRHLYESLLRSLVSTSRTNVRFVHGSVVGVIPDDMVCSKMNRPLKGVIIRNGTQTVHDAALLIDCTGTIQAGLKWLEKAGYALLPPSSAKPTSLRTSYNPKFSGTSFHFLVPTAAMRNVAIPHPEDFSLKYNARDGRGGEGGYDKTGCMYLYIPDPRRDFRNFLIQRVERDRLQIVCSGYDIPDRPTSISDIRTFISLANPAVPIPSYTFDLLNVLEEAAIPKEWHYIRVPPVSFVRYHEAHELPSNFVALGDATCQLNPIHGQGTTMAAICAITLNAALVSLPPSCSETLPSDFSRRFFWKQAGRLKATWEANKGDDYGFATTTPAQGEDRSYGWFRRWYGAHLAEIASRDDDVATVLWQVENFCAPGTDVFFPSVVGKVLWNSLVGGGS